MVGIFSKRLEKYVKSLHLAKNRRKEGLYFVEGNKMALDALSEVKDQVESMFVTEQWLIDHPDLKSHLGASLYPVTKLEMNRISALKTPTDVLAVMKQQDMPYDLSENNGLVLYLQSIRNPGNLGTIIRTADWFGISAVIASPDCVDYYNPKVVQASMSSIFRLPLFTWTLEELIQRKKDTPLLATSMHGQNVFAAHPALPAILMVGNEGAGLSEEALNSADTILTIPKAASGKAESLNAAIATAIISSILVQ